MDRDYIDVDAEYEMRTQRDETPDDFDSAWEDDGGWEDDGQPSEMQEWEDYDPDC